MYQNLTQWIIFKAEIAQLGERQTEDLKVACSIHALGELFVLFYQPPLGACSYVEFTYLVIGTTRTAL